jgi:GT2 family glycosyltransferase
MSARPVGVISAVLPCFNVGDHALAAATALAALPRPAGSALEIIVVDDASTDDSAARLDGALAAPARLLRAPRNLGRGGAINLGAAAARGEALLILDADCLPASDALLLAHAAALEQGADASVGGIDNDAPGFWGRYQAQAAARRAREAARSGDATGMTTANTMVRMDAFRGAGGFDPRYRHYGFEDRDLLLRLRRAGARLRFNEAARVRHEGALELPGIARKLRACGRHSAPLFRAQHPDAYRRLGYAAVDALLHPVRGALLAPLAALLLPRVEAVERLLQREALPFALRAGLARLVTALAYGAGTREAA